MIRLTEIKFEIQPDDMSGATTVCADEDSISLMKKITPGMQASMDASGYVIVQLTRHEFGQIVLAMDNSAHMARQLSGDN